MIEFLRDALSVVQISDAKTHNTEDIYVSSSMEQGGRCQTRGNAKRRLGMIIGIKHERQNAERTERLESKRGSKHYRYREKAPFQREGWLEYNYYSTERKRTRGALEPGER